jgi:hypothetical protein
MWASSPSAISYCLSVGTKSGAALESRGGRTCATWGLRGSGAAGVPCLASFWPKGVIWFCRHYAFQESIDALARPVRILHLAPIHWPRNP